MNQTKLMWCDVLWFYFVKWTPTPRAAILKEDRETVSSLIPLLGVFNIQIHSTGIYWEPLGSWWISNYGVREIKPDKTSMPRRKITAMIYLSLHTQLALSTCGSLVSGDLLGSKTGICSSPYIKWLDIHWYGGPLGTQKENSSNLIGQKKESHNKKNFGSKAVARGEMEG